MIKADLHIHTKYSMDCDTSLEKIIVRCKEIGINCLAVSDHGTIEGALRLKEMAPFPIIVAEEILTSHGEIMGMFLKERIPSGSSTEETIARIREQGGLVCIPHPFDIFRRSALSLKYLSGIIDKVDIMEVFNSKTPFQWNALQARAVADKYGIAQSAGSDAHTLHQIGNAYLEMPEFDGTKDFLTALRSGVISGRRTNPIFQFSSLWARVKKSLSR